MTVNEASGVAVYRFETWYFILQFAQWLMVLRKNISNEETINDSSVEFIVCTTW